MNSRVCIRHSCQTRISDQIIRERILSAAMQRFAERGFDGVSIDSLAREIRVSPQTIIINFGRIEDLYAATIDTALAEWTSETVAFESIEGASLASTVRLIMSALLAPVIVRASHSFLLRLVAWDLLQITQRGRRDVTLGCGAVIARLLQPYLPDAWSQDRRELVIAWLISQCLMLSPALDAHNAQKPINLTFCEARADLISEMALAGLEAMVNRTPKDVAM